jgi:RimJ/RimL family protein N-acetyltransferase
MSPSAKDYRQIEPLRGGGDICIRALKPDDRTDLLEAVEQMSPQSLRTRFFSPKRYFSETEVAYFVEVDFVRHVALVAELLSEEDRPIVGGARYVLTEPGKAEIAFTVVDAYQGRGIGGILMRHLVKLARDAGLQELFAEVLPENHAMAKVFEKSGLSVTRKLADGTMHFSFALA